MIDTKRDCSCDRCNKLVSPSQGYLLAVIPISPAIYGLQFPQDSAHLLLQSLIALVMFLHAEISLLNLFAITLRLLGASTETSRPKEIR